MKLADRMIKTFCANVSATAGNPWMKITTFLGDTDVKVMVKNNIKDTAMPPGTSVVFTTSLWLEVSPNRLFNFLRHENSRTKVCLITFFFLKQTNIYMYEEQVHKQIFIK